MESKDNSHKWTFFKAGGFYQANISTGEDIANIGNLDQKLWAALGCPTRGLVFDEKTLDIIDADSDKRIRHNEVVNAVNWTCGLLKDKNLLLESSQSLPLENIDDSTADGAVLLASARRILTDLGKPNAKEISVSDFDNPTKIFANTLFNADGIITADSCGADAALAATLADIAAVCKPKTDRSGKSGIDEQGVKDFYAAAEAYAKWLAKPEEDASILPLGADTDAAYTIFKNLKAKIDDFFLRTEILAFDSCAASGVNAQAAQLEQILSKEISTASAELRALPIARVAAGGSLDFSQGVNPAWQAEIAAFATEVVAKIFKSDSQKSLDAQDWEKIKNAFAPYAAWRNEKPAGDISAISKERVAEILKLNQSQKLFDLIAQDNAVKPEIDNINLVEKLVRLNANIFTLLRNFVNFGQFYKDEDSAIFQLGKLYIDQRVCELCIKVEDAAAHASLAILSYGYLLYCTCKRNGEPDLNIVAVVTGGEADNIMAGRHGIFYDRNNRDWDAVVTKIIANPIGLRQAFFSPYKRFVQWASEQLAKRAAAADTGAVNALTAAPASLAATANSADPKKKIDLGTVAALGVAIGGITTALGLFLNALFGLGYWLPVGIIGAVLAISLPSVLIAAIKLNSRNLAPLLDANGWAVNSKARISMVFGLKLTSLATLPHGSKCGYKKPEVERK